MDNKQNRFSCRQGKWRENFIFVNCRGDGVAAIVIREGIDVIFS